jgi:hypothetical protein
MPPLLGRIAFAKESNRTKQICAKRFTKVNIGTCARSCFITCILTLISGTIGDLWLLQFRTNYGGIRRIWHGQALTIAGHLQDGYIAHTIDTRANVGILPYNWLNNSKLVVAIDADRSTGNEWRLPP